MKTRIRHVALGMLLILALFRAVASHAVEPGEMLDDPVLEARAREISKDLRCLVCRNENIDSSNAGIAADLRVLVRERLVAGDSDEQAIAYIVDRYGEYVLLRPTRSWSNLALWAAGPVLFLIGLGIALIFVRRRKTVAPESLSDSEQERLREIVRFPFSIARRAPILADNKEARCSTKRCCMTLRTVLRPSG
jgi:cytochrome c-type biogenesis protein CcmH